MLNPAKRVVEKFGGYTKLAKAAQVDRSSPWRWAQAKETTPKGCDGIIPADKFKLIMNEAKKQGIDLELWELTNVYD